MGFTVDFDAIRRRKEEIVMRYGPWTAHNIHLGQGLHTMGEQDGADDHRRLRRVVQIVSDIAREPLQNLRVLDLACLEGLFAIEFALRGAEVVAIEGREANLEKARFARDVLSLERLKLVLDDVRHISKQTHGDFDVVLCLGILYHLNVPDAFGFMERVAQVCRQLAVIDTHISLADEESYVWRGKVFWGSSAREHADDSTAEERQRARWNSLDNCRSFCLTRSSLCNLLRNVGFTSVYECHNPLDLIYQDRVTLVAMKGSHRTFLTSPGVNALADEDWPEKPEQHVYRLPENWPGQQGFPDEATARAGAWERVPASLKAIARKLLR